MLVKNVLRFRVTNWPGYFRYINREAMMMYNSVITTTAMVPLKMLFK